MFLKFKAFLYDLGIAFLVTLITNFSIYILNFKSISFDFLIKYKFYVYWFLTFLLFLIIRFSIKKCIDKLQDDPSLFFIMKDYKGSVKIDYLGFTWNVLFDYFSDPFISNGSEKVRLEDLKKVEIGTVEGPYCPKDKRKMKVTRNYWGLYKYKCPKCKYKRTLFKNLTTLENEVHDEMASKFR